MLADKGRAATRLGWAAQWATVRMLLSCAAKANVIGPIDPGG